MDLTFRIRPWFDDGRNLPTLIGLATGVYIALSIYRSSLSKPLANSIHRSPRSDIASLSKSAQDTIPYPPNALPNSRDIATPYGNVRSNLYGSSSGKKIFLVHGISTPSVVFAPLANLLAEKYDCQVLSFDLWGRGYSDAPNPAIWRQDEGLFCAQILSVLSDAGWLGERVVVVGYSLGGGIASAFTYFYPEIVESLVLIAPSGVLRPERIAWSSRLIYSPLLPRSLTYWLVKRRLRGGAQPKQSETPTEPTALAEATSSEIPSRPAAMSDSAASPFPAKPELSIAQAVTWQIDNHPGYVPSFVSSICHAPITAQHERWRVIGERQKDEELRLKQGKTLVLLGRDDGTIMMDETREDAIGSFGEGSVRVEVLDGGHDVVVVNAEGCAKTIVDFLG